MPTFYYYVRDGAAAGPVRFRELVRLVHRDELGADDLVRADYDNDWRSAASIVGLFHMARREDVLVRWGIENDPSDAGQICSPEPAGSGGSARDKHSESIGGTELHPANDPDEAVTQFPASDPTESAVPNAITAAVAAWDGREHLQSSQTRPTTIPRQSLHRALRWGISLVLANLMAVGVVGWSTTEAQRRPDPEQMSAGIRPFPLWGPCGQTQYAALLVGTMGVAGAAGYAGTRFFEVLADN